MTEDPNKTSSAVKALVRVAVGTGVFALLIARTDLEGLWQELQRASVVHLAGAIALFFAGLGVSALRWREYLIALGHPIPYPSLYRLYFVGTFFNAFLPTGVGGDAYKAMRIGKARGRTAWAFASVFLDRFAGMAGLAVIALTLSAVRVASGDRSWVVVLAGLSAAGAAGGTLVLLTFGERLLGRGRLIPHTGVGAKIRDMLRGIHAAGKHPRASLFGLLLGVAFQLIGLWLHVLVAGALRITGVPVAVLGSIIMLASMAVLAPISLSGLGVVEFVYVKALAEYGVPNFRAVAFALVIRAVSLLASATGGVVYLVLGGEIAGTDEPRIESRVP